MPIPNVKKLTSCQFPLVERSVGGRTVLMFPPELRRLFTKSGAHVVRIPSLSLARLLPNFGSEASGESSFLPHKDNFGDDEDPKRYLVLSKKTPGARGSQTLACMPEVAALMLPTEETYFHANRTLLATERGYNAKFHISEEQYHHCFDDPRGYEAVIAQVLVEVQDQIPELTIRLNILNYLMRGPSVEPLMQELMQTYRSLCVEESWENGGVLIIDNAAVFHLRVGGNFPPLERNFCI